MNCIRCDTCEAFTNLSEEEKNKKKAVYSLHSKMKDEARRLMSLDKDSALIDKTVCCANFDMQKILTTPRAEISVLYYMSKLSVWNFTIFKLGIAQGHSILWNETIGRRGSNEIASFVL